MREQGPVALVFLFRRYGRYVEVRLFEEPQQVLAATVAMRNENLGCPVEIFEFELGLEEIFVEVFADLVDMLKVDVYLSFACEERQV